ncbi:hypothetical protein FYC62_14970 [Pedobacter aquae]|uniref:Uncharacterized protein n=1 Tax=Pedobacter aquae TaxID=2605747 RepID=A0A5C0VND8_9SPHI|nr:hypothetical protein [Pedobacter aquae]QEK52820.1 hypothetical protein FYC62_14970 [Pedobacter aquae]
MKDIIYTHSLLVVDSKGQIFRIFTPFLVIEKLTQQKYWVSKIVWDAFGLPYFEIEGNLAIYSKFKI